MFDDTICLRANLGPNKLQAGHLISCCFGPNQSVCVAGVSQTLDKIVIHETSAVRFDPNEPSDGTATIISPPANVLLESKQQQRRRRGADPDSLIQFSSGDDEIWDSGRTALENIDEPIYYITIKDVIRSLAVCQVGHSSSGRQSASNRQESLIDRDDEPLSPTTTTTTGQQTKDLLLIGCSNSILIYDTLMQCNLSSLSTSTSVSFISQPQTVLAPQQIDDISLKKPVVICGGDQRLYAIKFDHNLSHHHHQALRPLENTAGPTSIDAEISGETATIDSLRCLIQGQFNDQLDLIVTGSLEHKIRFYVLDPFDHNINTCQLVINESNSIDCLCPIFILTQSTHTTGAVDRIPLGQSTSSSSDREAGSSLLPSVTMTAAPSVAPNQAKINSSSSREQVKMTMNYLAYGSVEGFIGVYRIFLQHLTRQQRARNRTPDSASHDRLASERLWRHRCKQTPLIMVMFDLNGDGLDELIIGYRNSRLEARSPFTGQLMASTRCFNRQHLAGLTVMQDQLVACSTSGSLVGFKPLRTPNCLATMGQMNNSSNNNHSNNLFAAKDSNLRRGYHAHMLAAGHHPLMDGGLASGGDLEGQYQSVEDEDDDDDDGVGALLLSSSLMSPNEQSNKQSLMAASRPTSLLEDGDQQVDFVDSISSSGNKWKASGCDSRQSAELLQQLSCLHKEQSDLERRACQVYHETMHELTNFEQHLSPASANITFSWDFDYKSLKLKLTIAISTLIERVDLIELHDETRNLLPTGHLLISPSRLDCETQTTSNNGTTMGWRDSSSPVTIAGHLANNLHNNNNNNQKQQQQQQQTNELIVSVLLGSRRDEEARLEVRIYCTSLVTSPSSFVQPKISLSGVAESKQIDRIYVRPLVVPKFAMFAPLPNGIIISNNNNNNYNRDETVPNHWNSRRRVRLNDEPKRWLQMVFRLESDPGLSNHLQILDWLNEHFLCLQFGQQTLAAAAAASTPIDPTNPPSAGYNPRNAKPLIDDDDRIAGQDDDDDDQSDQHQRQHQLIPSKQASRRRPDSQIVQSGEQFEICLLDARQTLRNLNATRDVQLTVERGLDGVGASTREKVEEEDHDAADDDDDDQVGLLMFSHHFLLTQRRECKSVSSGGVGGEILAMADHGWEAGMNNYSRACSPLRIAYTGGGDSRLELECESSDLLVELVRFLVIDRLQVKLTSNSMAKSGGGGGSRLVEAKLDPILEELNRMSQIRQLKESEMRIQTELYESADYTRQLMQQFAIANQLNEFSTSKELLNELGITLSGTQNAAQAHHLNNRTRCELTKQIGKLKEKISFLAGQSVMVN